MPWERLLADLTAQLEQAERDEDVRSAADRVRVEHGAIPLLDRLRAGVGSAVTVRTSGGSGVRGVVAAAGPDWVTLTDDTGAVVVPAGAIAGVAGLRGSVVPLEALSPVRRRLDLRSVLRQLVADGTSVAVVAAGREVRGQVTRVGQDYVEVASDDGTWAVVLTTVELVRV